MSLPTALSTSGGVGGSLGALGARTLYELVSAHAATTPEAVAIQALNRKPLTYACLLGQLEVVRTSLRQWGIRRNDRVAVVLPNGPEMATAFVAVAAAATCAPLNPAYRDAEFDFYLSDLKAKALIVSSGAHSPAQGVARRLGLAVIELPQEEDGSAGAFRLRLDSELPPNGCTDGFADESDTALVLHTSGTTSRPKIVPLTHLNICSSGNNIAQTLNLTSSDRCLNVMPLFHIHGLIGALTASLSAGGSVICTPGFEASRFFDWLAEFNPSWYTAVPTIHQAILAQAKSQPRELDTCALRFVRSSSASLPVPVFEELQRVFRCSVIEAYGMTEASHQMASNPLNAGTQKAGSVGLAAGPEIAIMDPASPNLLQRGEVGEVVIRGTNVTDGYENNPEANQKAFLGGWFRTGDEGRFDEDGYLYLTGRLKELINRGGEKIAPREVDDILSAHPAVAQAVTFAVPHASLGEDVAAAVVLRPGAIVSISELVEFAATHLAEFKVPRQVLILDELPKGPTGKLQRIGLAEKLADQLARQRESSFVAAQDSVEQQLVEVWSGLLKQERVGVRDNFYVIGGDSLSMMAMIVEVERQFNKSVPLDRFLASPTIEVLAAILSHSDTTSNSEQEKRVSRRPIRDGAVRGLANRLLQLLALYAPGYRSTRVWLHRLRGVTIGKNVSIGLSSIIETAYPALVRIGDNVSIGMRTIIIAHLRDSTAQSRALGQQTVEIKDGSYIGPGVIVLPNVTIGAGAVVSAGSVVTRSVPPRTMVRGNPAVPIAHCGVSLGGGVSYEEFLRHLSPISAEREVQA
jgi:acyl-CoA synthetase (AMP-forming)/AMP-acid ligase II/acetyltransferase-like isoleucine patch superfamily enzyme